MNKIEESVIAQIESVGIRHKQEAITKARQVLDEISDQLDKIPALLAMPPECTVISREPCRKCVGLFGEYFVIVDNLHWERTFQIQIGTHLYRGNCNIYQIPNSTEISATIPREVYILGEEVCEAYVLANLTTLCTAGVM